MSRGETRFRLQSYDSSCAGRLGILTLTREGGPRRPPVFDRAALDSLEEALDEFERQDPSGLLVTGKPFGFAAGADLDEFVGADAAFAREAVATAFEVAGRLKKRAVRCADATAFVVNRLLLRFMVPCLQAASAGAGFRDVDRAIQTLGLPMGPFALLGLVGPEIAWHTLESLHEAFPERFPLDRNLRMLAEGDHAGVYTTEGEVDEEVRGKWEVDAEARAPGEEEIRQRALEALAREVHALLEQDVVEDARDVDTCLILGAGWPFFTGGICKHLDQIGISEKLFGEPLVGPEDPTRKGDPS